MIEEEFQVGDVVKLNSVYCLQNGLEDYPSVRFVVEVVTSDFLSVRCVSTGGTNNTGFVTYLGYFGPPVFFKRDLIKDKFKGRKSCG